MEVPELVPLEGGRRRTNARYTRQPSHIAPASCYREPLKALRVLLLLVLTPTIFICLPLYIRYRVYSGQMYPMGMTDMRLIDSKISTTWCQRQVIRSNTTFNAFVMPDSPAVAQELVPVTMTRHLELEDDMKEYWGFYLLQGSTVTVSACVRWPGASLIMIKGYGHLQNCAYIGDDSSEELDELLEANKLGLMSNTTLIEKLLKLNKQDGPANDPDAMKRHREGVSFLDPKYAVNDTLADTTGDMDVTDHDPKELRSILERLHAIREAAKVEIAKHYKPPSHLMALPALHRHRDTNVDRDERQWLSFKDLDAASAEDYSDIDNGDRRVPSDPQTKDLHSADKSKANNTDGDLRKQKYGKNARVSREPSSSEIYEDVLKKLKGLGDKGHRVIKKLYNVMGEEGITTTKTKRNVNINLADEKQFEILSKVIEEAIDEENTKSERQKRRHEANGAAKRKREVLLGGDALVKELNEDDEARDYAAEEVLEPDGYAEHHTKVNETTAFDMSNSEFWSSFSSSEEALLECDGLILNLPLTPHSECRDDTSPEERMRAAQRNAVTYRVPSNGYYFFVFNSENEVQRNFISVRFDLQKTMYDVARTALRECRNSTARCDLNLDLFSTQKVVLELPYRDNESLWNEQFVVLSECEPRTSIYLACVIAVPLLVLIFAFQ